MDLILGTTADGQAVRLRGAAAAYHRFVLGVSGAGKSLGLAILIVQLINQGIAVCLLDPHGDLCLAVLAILADTGFYAVERAYERVRYLPFNRDDASPAFNVLEQPFAPHKIASFTLEAFKRAFPDLDGSAAILLNNLQLGAYVLRINHEPLTKLPALLSDSAYQGRLLARVTDPLALDHFARMEAAGKRGGTQADSALRRLSLLFWDLALRRSLGQRQNTLNFRQLMDTGVSTLINLGGLEAETQRLLGSLIAVNVEEAALSRADLPTAQRRPFAFIMDEAGAFSARSATALDRILSQTRKYNVSLTLAAQSVSQFPAEARAALSNANLICFRVGADDAHWAAERLTTVDTDRVNYSPTGRPAYMSGGAQIAETRHLLMTLPTREALLRVNGETTRFRALEVPPRRVTERDFAAIQERYAQRWLTPRAQLESLESAEGQRMGLTGHHDSSDSGSEAEQGEQGIPETDAPRASSLAPSAPTTPFRRLPRRRVPLKRPEKSKEEGEEDE